MTTVELELATTKATLGTGARMKALVYHGPGKYAWEDKPRPAIQDPGDNVRLAVRSREPVPQMCLLTDDAAPFVHHGLGRGDQNVTGSFQGLRILFREAGGGFQFVQLFQCHR